MKTKILYVILNGKEYGGSEKHVVDIINNIDKKKYEIYLIMSKKNIMKDNIDENNIKKIYLLNRNNPLCILKIRRIIKKIKPNIIHAHAARGVFITRLACKKIKVKQKFKLLCTIHGWILEYLKFNKLLQKMLLLNRELDDKTLTVSKFSMDELIEKGYEPKKLKYIYNGIDTKKYNENAIIKRNVKNISYIGRFTNQKGIIYLMNAIEKLKDYKYNFYIYGAGELEEYIKEFINKKVLRNVTLGGFIESNNVKEKLYNTDILLLPSIDEGFPYILVEAIACGVPCIATKVGGVGEIIDDSVGKLINSKNEEEICNAIIEIEKGDIGILSKNCIEKSNEFNIYNMIRQIEDVYGEVLNEK